MGIQTYFDQIKTQVDQYATTDFVLNVRVDFETRPGEQGYLVGLVTFADGSALHFREFLDAVAETTNKVMYVYQYQDANHQLILQYGLLKSTSK